VFLMSEVPLKRSKFPWTRRSVDQTASGGIPSVSATDSHKCTISTGGVSNFSSDMRYRNYSKLGTRTAPRKVICSQA